MKDGNVLRQELEKTYPELAESGFYTVILKKRNGY
jgi:hypothetical protein